MNLNPITSAKEYDYANTAAQTANELARDASHTHIEYLDQKDRLDNWNRIMSIAPVFPFLLFFIAITIGEFYFSKEIYRVISRSNPWIIAFALAVVGIFISDFIAYLWFGSLRTWKRYELRRDKNRDHLTEDEMDQLVKSFAVQHFVFGLVLGILLIAGIGWLSLKRVQLELAAGLRTDGFCATDLLPVILYVLEILSGIFIVYMFKHLGQKIRVRNLYSQFTKLVKSASEFTSATVSKFQIAEGGQHSPIGSHISDNVHEAHFRYKMKDVNNEEDYIQSSTKENQSILFQINNKEGQGVVRQIDIVTEFKFSLGGTTDTNGKIVFSNLFTFRGDSVKDVFIREASTSTDFKKIESTYTLNNAEPHVIIVE